MYHSAPRTAAHEVLADRRPSTWPQAGGRALAPVHDPRRNYVGRGPHQATEVGRGASGLGQGSAEEQIARTGVVAAGTIMSGLAVSAAGASAASVAAGGAASTAFMASSLAVPVIGAVVAGVVLALTLLFNRKGPKQKVATTSIVNKVEPLLQENLRGYMAGPRTVSSQAQALENFKAGWAYVVEYCDTPVMGAPGQACVQDRQRGGQWPWAEYYYDPIANDPGVMPDPQPGETLVRNADGTGTIVTSPSTAMDLAAAAAGIPAPLLIGLAAIALALTMGGKR